MKEAIHARMQGVNHVSPVLFAALVDEKWPDKINAPWAIIRRILGGRLFRGAFIRGGQYSAHTGNPTIFDTFPRPEAGGKS